jgi:5-formyltetrahydrofolate cyclo-ligase
VIRQRIKSSFATNFPKHIEINRLRKVALFKSVDAEIDAETLAKLALKQG